MPPSPIKPSVIRSLGALRCAELNTEEGTIAGIANTAELKAACCRNCLRVMRLLMPTILSSTRFVGDYAMLSFLSWEGRFLH
jgi:late competence protein required for DNA uptake (superfamily II DNA/RNA helicase)